MRGIRKLFVVAILSSLAGCAPAITSEQAGLEVRVQDHEEAIDQFQSTEVTISGLEVHTAIPDQEAGWIDLPLEQITLDLTQYVGGPYAVIFGGEALQGSYDGVRITVSEASGVLKDGTEVELELPEFSSLPIGFIVQPDQETILLLDLVVVTLEDHLEGGYGLLLSSATLVWE
ncbi:MAG: DUF4382 domain-containing protein [Chloroflexi bacterium]|nr:DUF4382 domain-containing protein [Chloroflexota bacterium]